MFYVSNGKIYLAEFNKLSGVYPEVHLVDGAPKVLKTGSARKPADRTICNLREVIAQFGATYPKVLEEKTKK